MNFKRKSFQQQLYILLSTGAVLVALTISLIATWVSNRQTSTLMIHTGIQHSISASRQSRLALLYASSDNAVEAARSILAFPSINRIAIINPDLSILYEIKKHDTLYKSAIEDIKSIKDIKDITTAKMISEDSAEWRFIAPVYINDKVTDQENIEQALLPQTTKIIGYVYLAASKDSLKKLQNLTLKINLTTVLIVTLIMIGIIHLLLRHFFQPLNSLTRVMHDSIQGELAVYSGKLGPSETRQIASAYNRLVNAVAERDIKLKKHNQLLESTVEKRTQELIVARDAAIEAEKHKSEFLANTTHELRTPLQSIIGYAEVARETADEEAIDELSNDMDNILTSATHLLSLINTILDISKVETGNIELTIDDNNIYELVEQAEKIIQPLVTRNNSLLKIKIDCENPIIRTDKSKLFQVILNLLGNAAKFTENGTIEFTAHCTTKQLKLTVKDSGIGIAKDRQKLIFEAFQQADGSVIRKYGGTGLGLYVTRQFCHLLHGHINLTSTEGKGSVFEVTIPLTEFTK